MAESKVEHLLDSIHFPEDLRHLSQDKLEQVCADLRQYIIDVLSENPGHLGASLGTVELTVALHYVFNTPYDRIVWDVGHQAYGHKILTGRKDIFHTLRKFKGISGFPNPAESEYDAFIAGHASNSISAAMGMSVASALKKELDRHVIAVIGDGAMTGGLAFEGLNNASANPNNLLIILNDNDMAIDHSVGGLSQYLVDITTSQAYNKMRYDVYRGLKKIKLINNVYYLSEKNTVLHIVIGIFKSCLYNRFFDRCIVSNSDVFKSREQLVVDKIKESIARSDFAGFVIVCPVCPAGFIRYYGNIIIVIHFPVQFL